MHSWYHTSMRQYLHLVKFWSSFCVIDFFADALQDFQFMRLAQMIFQILFPSKAKMNFFLYFIPDRILIETTEFVEPVIKHNYLLVFKEEWRIGFLVHLEIELREASPPQKVSTAWVKNLALLDDFHTVKPLMSTN